ncbi:MAG TPA: acyltransferase family protein [Polyangiaceae bacterium]|jgi:peptidoglycan/LPS O-acetylase OafA/YrhL
MRHRKDIDGLRAIAVLSVVLFHLGFSERIGGGFVGVDVFFVISGYLITGILEKDIELGRMSLVEFYNRRVRRIFPALFVVHVFCLIASSIVLFPDAAKAVGHDVLRSLAFVSNVAFARADGYFNQSSKVAPLLHTWSLSVEEQFYIGLPLTLLALARVPRWARLAVLASLAVLSFLAAEVALGVDARGAFYFVQYRAWELLVGSLLALEAVPRVRSRRLAEALGVLGLALILWAVLRIDEATPFPGHWALPPCLGALMLLHSGSEVETLTARVLGSAPLRWVGVVSYSLYLWHWPLIALYNARYPTLTNRARVAILLLALLASVISYRYVERPFRSKPYRRSARTTLALAASAMALVAVLAVGLPVAAARLHPTEEMADAALKYLKYNAEIGAGTCFLHSGFDDARLFRRDICLKLVPGCRSVLIMGDSHAAHFVEAFKARHAKDCFLQVTASGCEAVRQGSGSKRCTRLFSEIFDDWLPSHRINTIILAGRWPRATLPQLQNTIDYLKPMVDRVVVLGPVVEYDQPFPQLLAESILAKDPSLSARHLVSAQRRTDRYFAEQLASSGADYFSVYDATCPAGECTQWAAPGVPMQYDAHHLTLQGAELVIDRLGATLLP